MNCRLIALGLSFWAFSGLQAQKSFSLAELAKGRTPMGFYAPLPQVIEWKGDNALALKTKAHPDSAMADWPP